MRTRGIPLLEADRAVMTPSTRVIKILSYSLVINFCECSGRQRVYDGVVLGWYGGDHRHCDEGWLIGNLEKENERFWSLAEN